MGELLQYDRERFCSNFASSSYSHYRKIVPTDLMSLHMSIPLTLSTWLYLFVIVMACIFTVVVCMKLMLLRLALVIISELPIVRWMIPIQLPAQGRHRGML